MNRTLSLALAFFSLPAAALPQSAVDRQFDFDGGARLHVSIDSMTDRQVCSAMTPNNGAWIAVNGPSTALIVTANVFVDYNRPALLRIGDAAPFRLFAARDPHFIAIPLDKSAAIVRALYTRQRVRLRFFEYPEGGLFDQELDAGDFASAYDRGVELCGWPKLSVAGVHPAAAPQPAPELVANVKVSGASCLDCAADFEAKAAGSIVLRAAAVASNGRLEGVTVASDSGTGIGEIVADAVRSWRFSPGESGAPPISITVTFRPRESRD